MYQHNHCQAMRLQLDLEGVASAWQAVGGSIFTCEPQPGVTLDLAGIFSSMYGDCRHLPFCAQAATTAVLLASQPMAGVWSSVAAASHAPLPGSGGCDLQPAWLPHLQQAESTQQLQQVSGVAAGLAWQAPGGAGGARPNGYSCSSTSGSSTSGSAALLQAGPLKRSHDAGEGSPAREGHCRPAAANSARSVRPRLAALPPATASNTGTAAAAATQPSAACEVCVGSRGEALARHRQKKACRVRGSKVRYVLRKINADKRPRVGGRFVSKQQAEGGQQGAYGSSSSSSVACGVAGLGTLGALPGAAMDGEQLWLQPSEGFDELLVGADVGDEPSDVSDCDRDLLMVG